MKTLYFAGGFYVNPTANGDVKRTFDLCGPSGDKKRRPYVTENPNGLRVTGDHACLWMVSDDMKTATCVAERCPRVGRYGITVVLSEDQRERIQASIDTNFFF